VRESGYTLVELVGTLVIVGCLASVALPGFFSVDQAAVRRPLRLRRALSRTRSSSCA